MSALLHALLPAVQAFTAHLQVKGVPRILWHIRGLLTQPNSTYRMYKNITLTVDNDTLYQWWNVVNYGGFETILLLERLLRPGDVFIDVGANIGYMAVNAARVVGSGGRVLAVEPEPRVRRKLLRNVELNAISNLEVIDAAVGLEEGIATFSVATEEGLSRLDHGHGENPCMILLETIQVPVITLDRLIETRVQKRPVRLVKMDVEGFEYAIFKGATKLLERQEAIFIFENNAGALAQNGVSLVEIVRLLKDAGYDLFSINSHTGDWFRIGRFPSLRLIADPATDAQRAIDVLAVPQRLRDLVTVTLQS